MTDLCDECRRSGIAKKVEGDAAHSQNDGERMVPLQMSPPSAPIRSENAAFPLNIASGLNHVECVKAILAAGADVNDRIEEATRGTALMEAASQGNTECVEILVEAGADVNLTNGVGKTALMILLSGKGSSECVNYLLKAAADVNITTDYDCTAIKCAAQNTNHENLELLIKSGADVNKPAERSSATWGFSHAGYTALMHAAFMRDYRSVNLLIQAGADVNALNSRSECALDQATDVRCVRLLLQSGTKIYPRPTGLKPLDKPSVLLLHAAGQRLNGHELKIATEISHVAQRLRLKNLCRQEIREHLLRLDPHTHLYGTVPRLALPHFITEYLLHGVSLDDIDAV